MADGPCGDTFKEAFTCFVRSDTDPKGSDCMEQFSSMHVCLTAHQDYYSSDDDEEGEATPPATSDSLDDLFSDETPAPSRQHEA